jgi:outer membrane lipoprotein-sorting protein
MAPSCRALIVLIAWLVLWPSGASGAESEVAEVLRQVAAQDDAVSDLTAQLLIRSFDARGVEQTSQHRLYWKNQRGKPDVLAKTVVATLSPIHRKGERFLLWQAERAEESQAWLYLPELRQVRRVVVAGPEAHRHDRESDVDLGFEQLATRVVASGESQVVGRETLEGATYVILEDRTPVGHDTPPIRRMWVSAKDWTIAKIEYREADGRLNKAQRIEWRRVNDAWVWTRTEIQKAHSRERTVIELNEVAVNPGLDDRVFTIDTLKSGRLP